MNVLDLFSGIGGFSLGLERAGMRIVAFCEIDPYCQRVLRKHWPDVPVFRDVRELTAEAVADAIGNAIRNKPRQRNGSSGTDPAFAANDGAARIDLICGGFPCQDISVAGKGAGIAGERSGLWSEYARIIGEVRPRYVIIENVANLLSGRSADEQPIDRCLCGWPCRWRRVPVGSEQEGSMVHAALRHRHDGEGAANSGEVAQAIWRQSGVASQGDGEMGSGIAMGDRRRSLQADADGDIAVLDVEEGTGSTADLSGQRSWANDQATGFRIEPEGAERSGEHWLCPSCGRTLAHQPTRSVVTTWMGRVLGDLAALGFDAEWHCIPASAVGAPHRRDRVWIIAYPNGCRQSQLEERDGAFRHDVERCGVDVADATSARQSQPFRPSPPLLDRETLELAGPQCSGWDHWLSEPDVGGVAHGVPPKMDGDRLDGQQELSALQQAINPSEMVKREIGQHLQRPQILQPYLLRALRGEPWIGEAQKRKEERTTASDDGSMQSLRSDNEIATASQGSKYEEQRSQQYRGALSAMSHTGSFEGWNLGDFWAQEPDTPRVARGVKDRVSRLRALGNAIVPQIAEIIGRAIMSAEAEHYNGDDDFRPLDRARLRADPRAHAQRRPRMAAEGIQTVRKIDLGGMRFGRLTVVACAGSNKRRVAQWECLCDCGVRVVADGWHLRSGQSQSCGCLRRELNIARSTKHGISNSPEYYSWQAMKQRCSKPYAVSYKYYGARGVSFCEAWNDFGSFFADMGPRPPGHTLDRIDPNGNYEPGNVRWADAKQQRHNRRS